MEGSDVVHSDLFHIFYALTNKLIHYGKINQGNTDGEEPADDVRGRVAGEKPIHILHNDSQLKKLQSNNRDIQTYC